MDFRSHKTVSLWLFIGCLMVLVQIVIGGITRLTDSGLSITEWNVIKGTLPPLNELDWQIAFDKYKIFAKKQYESLHSDMNMESFKRIYFWEYFHRLWARMMGFVFIIPFTLFLIRKKIENQLLKRLLVVIFLASLSAIFGWIMVASGLNNDKRTWVNAYNLLIHLVLATSLFSYLVYTYYKYSFYQYEQKSEVFDRWLLKIIGWLIVLQIGWGALMAGMKAALVFPYPFILLKWNLLQEIWSASPLLIWKDWYDYEPNSGIKILVQIIHRLTAYSILILSGWFFFVNRVRMFVSPSYLIFYLVLLIQILLGIFTVNYSKGSIPIVLGVAHQLIAFILLASYLWLIYSSKKRR